MFVHSLLGHMLGGLVYQGVGEIQGIYGNGAPGLAQGSHSLKQHFSPVPLPLAPALHSLPE